MAETVAVLGGGVAGLAAAHYLGQLRTFPRILLMEASHRLGGWVSSTTYPDKVVFEHGPRTLRFGLLFCTVTLSSLVRLGYFIKARIVPWGLFECNV